jgi:hypothetical protein
MATANQDFYKIGDMYQSTSSFAGVYAVAGSGSQLFRKMMEDSESASRQQRPSPWRSASNQIQRQTG